MEVSLGNLGSDCQPTDLQGFSLLGIARVIAWQSSPFLDYTCSEAIASQQRVFKSQNGSFSFLNSLCLVSPFQVELTEDWHYDRKSHN